MNIIHKDRKNKIKSKISKDCKFKFEKNNNLGLIKARNVIIHMKIHTNVSTMTDLKLFKIFNIQKQYLIYTNII